MIIKIINTIFLIVFDFYNILLLNNNNDIILNQGIYFILKLK